MATASCRGVSEAIKLAASQGYDVGSLVTGLPVSLTTLTNPKAKISWDLFAEVTTRFEAMVGGPEAFVDFVRTMVDHPLNRSLQRLLGLAVTPMQVYRLMFSWFGPSHYPGQRSEVRALPHGRIHIVISMPKDQAGCTAFFRTAQGAMIGLPTILGLGEAKVEAELTPHRGEYFVETPGARSMTGYARRIFAVLSDSQAAVDELVRQQTELGDAFQELQIAHARVREHEQELERQIAERERAEKVAQELEGQLRHAQKMEALGTFAGGIAHDFNNLLTVVLSIGTEIDAVAADPAQVKAAGEELVEVAQRASRLTQQLLRFSRRSSLDIRVVDVNVVLRQLATTLSRLVAGAVDLRFELEAAQPKARLDPECLEQIIVNLVANARDALPDGGVVTIATRNQAAQDGAGLLRISVTDDGPGISDELKSRVFEPFVTTKAPGEGTGLGLAMVFQLTNRMEGEVEIISEPGSGTTVEIDFPSTVDELHPKSAGVPESWRPAQGESVLVVDDQAAVLNVMVRALSRAGYNVRKADSADEALRVIDEVGPFDLLITDVMLGTDRGTDLATQFKGEEENRRVLFVSGFTGGVGRAQVQPKPLLLKPFTIAGFLRTVRGVLDGGSRSQM